MSDSEHTEDGYLSDIQPYSNIVVQDYDRNNANGSAAALSFNTHASRSDIGRKRSVGRSVQSVFSLGRRNTMSKGNDQDQSSLEQSRFLSASTSLMSRSKMSIHNSIAALNSWLSEPVPGIDQQVENGEEDGRAGFNELDSHDADVELQESPKREFGMPTLMEVPSGFSRSGTQLPHSRESTAFRGVMKNIQSEEMRSDGPSANRGMIEEKIAPVDSAAILKTADFAERTRRDSASTDVESPPTSPSQRLRNTHTPPTRRQKLSKFSSSPLSSPATTQTDSKTPPPSKRRLFQSPVTDRRPSWTPGLPPTETDTPSVTRVLKNYAQSFIVSLIIGLPCNALVYGLSLLGWRWSEDLSKWKADQTLTVDHYNSHSGAMMSPTAFTVICTIMFTSALPLFNAVQFMALHSWKAFRRTGLVVAAPLSCLLAAGSLWGLWWSGWPFWFYYIDVAIILLSYISCTFLSGYYGQRGTVSRRERLIDAIEFGVIECFVSVAAVLYGLWIMPIFSWIPDRYKMFWRFTVHPLYWEIFVKFATRRLLIVKAGTTLNAIDTLSLAHAQAHITVMQVSIVAGLEHFSDLFIAVFVFGILRFIFRSLISYEHVVQKFVADRLWPLRSGGKLGMSDKTELEIEKYMMAIDIQTEIVQENAAVLFASTLAYLFWRYGDLFSMTMPEDASFGTTHVVATVLIQLGLNVLFDLGSIYFNSRWASRLPFQKTWREMWNVKWRFFGFQVYAMFTMGLAAQIYFMARLPRAVLCTDPYDTCSCKFLNHMAVEMCHGDTMTSAIEPHG